MKNALLWSSLSVIILFGTVSAVSARSYGLKPAASRADYSTFNSPDIYSTARLVTNGILAMVGFVFFGYTLYSGLRWLTAQGDKNAIAKAKSTLVSSVLGLAIMLAALGLTNFVFDQLGQ